MAVPALRTRRLLLEPLDPRRDADTLISLWADPRFSEFEISPPPSDRQQVMDRFAWVARMPDGLGGWVLRLDDGTSSADLPFVGRVSLREWEHEPAGPPELGWHLAPDYWGRGLATEAMRAVLLHARRTVGLDHVIALVRAENARSRAVAERLGGVERDRGEWWGAGWPFIRYDLRLGPRE